MSFLSVLLVPVLLVFVWWTRNRIRALTERVAKAESRLADLVTIMEARAAPQLSGEAEAAEATAEEAAELEALAPEAAARVAAQDAEAAMETAAAVTPAEIAEAEAARPQGVGRIDRQHVT